MLLAVLFWTGSALRLIEGRHVVRVGVSRRSSVDTSSHGYKRREVAISIAGLLVDEIRATGLSAVDDWNRDPAHWLDRIEASV